MNAEILWKILPGLCKLFRWFTGRKPTRGTVLIVEDDPLDAELLQIKLRKKGWASEIVSSGIAAEGLVKRVRYSIVFVDMRLPGMSGKALLRILSRDAPNTNVVIVCGEPSDLADVPAGMFLCFIRKPAELEAIEDMMKRLRIE
jgi:DNA-binding response OmpR family regulator